MFYKEKSAENMEKYARTSFSSFFNRKIDKQFCRRA